jgi:cytidylate kinase
MDNLIISVGRQIGSGGNEIAKMLAHEFGCKFYDKEILNLAAEKSGFSPKIFERNDENHGLIHSASGFFERLFNPYSNSISDENLFQIQSEVIYKIGQNENCVIMGRCADYILRNNPQLFSVFITADEEERCKEVAKRLESDYETARRFIAKHEAERANYYNYYTSKTWGAAQNYDVCINSSILGWEGTARLLSSIIRKKFNLLTLQA